jgi:hypothetical protein
MDVNGYTIHVVFGKDDYSCVVRTCLKRPSDGKFAVGYVERISFEKVEKSKIEDLATPISELSFSTEDAYGWIWHPTLQEAVEASKITFAPFEKWTADVPNP